MRDGVLNWNSNQKKETVEQNFWGRPLSMLITSPRNSYWIRKLQFIFPCEHSLSLTHTHTHSLSFFLPLVYTSTVTQTHSRTSTRMPPLTRAHTFSLSLLSLLSLSPLNFKCTKRGENGQSFVLHSIKRRILFCFASRNAPSFSMTKQNFVMTKKGSFVPLREKDEILDSGDFLLLEI